MKEYLNSTIETILQITALLLQTVGIFLVKPDVFTFYNGETLFAGGNVYNFLLLFLTIAFLYLSFTYNKKRHAGRWFISFVAAGVLFMLLFYFFNKTIDSKTIVFSNENNESVRYIKGDNYITSVSACAKELAKIETGISEEEVIKNCANVTDFSQLNKVWPEIEIKKNINRVNLLYCICLSIATITIVCGLQALKCKRVKV